MFLKCAHSMFLTTRCPKKTPLNEVFSFSLRGIFLDTLYIVVLVFNCVGNFQKHTCMHGNVQLSCWSTGYNTHLSNDFMSLPVCCYTHICYLCSETLNLTLNNISMLWLFYAQPLAFTNCSSSTSSIDENWSTFNQ